MHDKPNYYAVVPASVRYDRNISNGSKLLYGEISALCHVEGYCWATNEYFANLYDSGERTVSRWIEELSSQGHVKVVLEKGGRQIWLGGVAKNGEGGSPKMTGSIVSKSQETIQAEPQKVMQAPPNTTLNTTLKSGIAKKAPRSQFGKYNEAAASDSYEPVIDADSGEDISPAKPDKNPQLRKTMMALIHWAENRRGGKFLAMVKQLTAISKMKNAGIDPEQIKNRWVDMESDPFWKEKGFDFVNVASSFDRKP